MDGSSRSPAPGVWLPPDLDPAEWRLPHVPRGRRTMRIVDPVVAALALRQHGIVARAQLLTLGVSEAHADARLASGMLTRVHPGVYRVAGSIATGDSRRMAGVLACSRGTHVAGWTGATHLGALPDAGRRLDLAVPPACRPSPRRFTVVRTIPHAADQTVVRGVPTHTMARVLLDLARRPDGARVLEWAWRQAIYLGLLDISAVGALLTRHHGTPGTPAVRALYERRAALVGDVRNRFELLMLEIIREAGLPEPLCNVPWEVGDGLVLTPDFRIPELMLVIESDGRDGHADVEFLLSDDARDARYAALGYASQRYSYWEAKRQRGRVRDALAAHAAAFAAGWRPTGERVGRS